MVALQDSSDDVIELSWRGDIGINIARRVNECRKGFNTDCV
jgi:hypothetical protein